MQKKSQEEVRKCNFNNNNNNEKKKIKGIFEKDERTKGKKKEEYNMGIKSDQKKIIIK